MLVFIIQCRKMLQRLDFFKVDYYVMLQRVDRFYRGKGQDKDLAYK